MERNLPCVLLIHFETEYSNKNLIEYRKNRRSLFKEKAIQWLL